MQKIIKTNKEWRTKLTPEQYRITREKGTEPAFSGEYWNKHDKGLYICSNCGLELFSSDTKFDSKTGWPSFDNPINLKNIELKVDDSYGMLRTEVSCKRCEAHLGHLFNDGPTKTGSRYCINSSALKFRQKL
jgi:peptide-methionine (R)-S-oxide reductase